MFTLLLTKYTYIHIYTSFEWHKSPDMTEFLFYILRKVLQGVCIYIVYDIIWSTSLWKLTVGLYVLVWPGQRFFLLLQVKD